MPTILVADDNSNIQKMVTLAFKGEGIDVVAVGNGEAAVKRTIEIVPDLVLADIFMPVRSGYEVCEFLKQDSRFSHIPVVLLAGAFDPFDEREAQRVGADGVLKKPFVPPDPLVTLVKGLLAKNAERLVGVAVPVQTSAVSAQSSSAIPEALASSAPAFTPPPFVPPPFPKSTPDASVKEDEYPDDDIELGTTAPPMRDFSIPSAPVEPERVGGADAFGSMLDTSPLGTMMPPMRKLGEPEIEEEVGEDRDIEPASAHTAFEGFSPWRASASSAGVVEEEEAPEQTTEPNNQFMPSPKNMMGRVWEIDPAQMEKSPDETVVEPRDEMSPLTHSAQHVTTVRDEAREAVETPEVAEHIEAAEPGPAEGSKVSDWRSAFTQVPEEAAKIVEAPAPSMSPWRMFTPPVEASRRDRGFESSSATEVEAHAEPVAETDSADTPSSFTETAAEISSGTSIEAASSTEPAPSVAEDADTADAHAESFAETSTEVAESPAAQTDSQIEPSDVDHAAEAEHRANVNQQSQDAEEVAAPASTENSDWIAGLPEHVSPQDTVTIARSVIEQLAPSAVESVATSFPVPTSAPTDPRVVEDIVARVVERMQPQILDMITREVLRPVVEALVRRQLEQKLPE